MKTVTTPQGNHVMERRRVPPPRAIVSAQKGLGTSILTLLGITLPTILAWLSDPAHVKILLDQFPVDPALAALIIALTTGVAKFAWDYLSRKAKEGKPL